MTSYASIVALLKTALLLLSLAQGPNVPPALKTQAVSVANQAIAAATQALANAYKTTTPVVTVPAPPAHPPASSSPAPTPTPSLTLLPTPPPNLSVTFLKRNALVFSIDQNFGNGIIAKSDITGLTRMLASLAAFQQKYEVYVTLSADATDKRKLESILDTIAASSIPFTLDVYASDAITIGADSISAPYDIAHGRELSIAQLQEYKDRYGAHFAGVRAHEVFGQNAAVIGCQQLHANWCDAYRRYLPNDNFYQKSLLEEYVKFAHDNNMFLIFSDHYWSAYNANDLAQLAGQLQNEADLRELASKYPGTIVTMFANNEWNETSRSKTDIWEGVVQAFVQYGAKGFGLSDQSWMCNDENCPASELSDWASRAFSRGALVVETEPYWYWWFLPRGAIGPQANDYTMDATFANRGYPTQNLATLAAVLGVSFSSPTILQAAISTEPSGLSHSCNSQTRNATLSWNPVQDATSYWFRVIGMSQSACTANTDWQWIADEGGTCYPNPDMGPNMTSITFPMTPDTTYTWKVQSARGQTFSTWALQTFACN